MKTLRNFIALSITGLVLFGAQTASASAPVWIGADVRIEGPDGTVYDDTVYTSGCTVTDSTNVEHTYETATALCALAAAATAGGFEYEVVDSDFGLYLNSIDGTSGDFTNFWSFYIDFAMASEGLATYELEEDDQVLLTFGAWGETDPLKLNMRKRQVLVGNPVTAEVQEYDEMTSAFIASGTDVVVNFNDETVAVGQNGTVEFTPDTVGDITVVASGDSATQSNSYTLRVFPNHQKIDLVSREERVEMAENGIAYLLSQQDESGKISGSHSVTEWTAIALASMGEENEAIKEVVVKYNPKVENGTTEIARHILALEALGVDSTDVDGKNYVTRLKKTRSGNQFGSEAFVNDDIFAGLALLAAGEPHDSKALRQAMREALDSVNEDGGVSYAVAAEDSDVDTTAFLLQFIGASNLQIEGVSEGRMRKARRNAMRYINKQQNFDGGWAYQRKNDTRFESNASTTAVVATALRSNGRWTRKMRRNKRDAFNALKSLQRKSGAFKYNESGDGSLEALNTAYAVLALSNEGMPYLPDEE